MSAYRPEFEAALRLFARVSEAMKARGFQAPVLVGGAAVEIYSLSAIATGDFDISTGAQISPPARRMRSRKSCNATASSARPAPAWQRAAGFTPNWLWGLRS
jgi:hypothetical protein